MPTILLHIQNEEPVMGEVDDIPGEQDNLIVIKNPRRRDGKDIAALDPNVTTILYPVHRINFIEVLPSSEEEQIIGFVRE